MVKFRRGQISTELLFIFAALTFLGFVMLNKFVGKDKSGAIYKAGEAATTKIAKDN